MGDRVADKGMRMGMKMYMCMRMRMGMNMRMGIKMTLAVFCIEQCGDSWGEIKTRWRVNVFRGRGWCRAQALKISN